MKFAQTLKQLLFDELKAKRYLTVDEVIQIAVDNNYKASNAERRLRREKWSDYLPIIKIGRNGKPIKASERIHAYRYIGARTKLLREAKKFKRQKRSAMYAQV